MYTFVQRHQSPVLTVQRLCKLLKVSRSAYYAWCNRQPSQRELANQTLDRLISRLYLEANGFAGYRMIRGVLIESGIQASANRVRRRMCQIGIMGRQFKRKRNTTNSNHRLGCAPNLLQQDFTVAAPNQSWVGDITYLRVGNTWAYLSTVMDLFSRKVIGWALGRRIQTQLVRESFEMAMLRRGNPKGVIFHSDRGSQYASREFRLQLALTQTTQSMSGKGNCLDNAVAESFFKTLKTECAYRAFASFEQAQSALFNFIECRYNNLRPHSFNRYLSPNKKEQLYFQNQSNTIIGVADGGVAMRGGGRGIEEGGAALPFDLR